VSRGAADQHAFSVHQTAPREFLAIGIPSFGMVHLFFTARLLNLRIPMNTTIRWFYVIGKEVGDARNEIVARALEADGSDMRCKAVFFLDDDVLFHPDVLKRLLSHRRPIVSGLYYTKTAEPTPLALHDEGHGTAYDWTPGEVIDVAGHGMGLTLIDADVFRRLRDEQDLGVDAAGYPRWFRTTRDELLTLPGRPAGVYNQTEDMHFLTRARALGYQPAVDTAAAAFAWHFDTKRGVGYPLAQWQEWTQTGRITWPTPQGPVVWEGGV
jgi:glycosyltransferase involved in cell wall biosynthesis